MSGTERSRRYRWGLVLLLLAAVLYGCSRSEPKENWDLTGTFDVEATTGDGTPITYEMRGVPGKYGFIDSPFVAGQGNKYMWHFWGEPAAFVGKKLQVEATNREGRKVIVFEGALGGQNLGATAHIPSSMTLPEPGMWKLTIRVGGEVVGHIVVEAKPAG